MPKLAYSLSRRSLKPVGWVGPALDELRSCPAEVQDTVGYALYLAQRGDQRHPTAKRLKGSLRDVVEIRVDHATGTYRATYTTALGDAVYVLHVFKKKSTRGIATPRHVIALITARLEWARRDAHKIGEGDR